MLRSIIFAMATGGLVGPMAVAGEAEKLLERAQTEVYDFIDKDITKIEFAEGSATLSEAEKIGLRALVKSVRDDSRVEGIVVAAWSDHHYPEVGKKLSDADVELADRRQRSVEAVLDELGIYNISTYSMAEHPSWIGKVFFTEESKVKKSIEGEEVEDRDAVALAATLQNRGGPSSAVVIVKRAVSFYPAH